MRDAKKKIKFKKTRWRGSFGWKREENFLNWVAKTNKISFYCFLLSHQLWQWRKIILMKKMYMPLPFEEKAQPEWACDASIFYFFHLALGMVCLFFISIHLRILFHPFFVAEDVFISIETEAKEILVKMSFIFLSFSSLFFLKCEITIFFFFFLFLFFFEEMG